MLKGIEELDVPTLLGLCIWAEARGEPELGQQAIGWVVRNRADHPRWWGNSIDSVILTPAQFSWTATSNPEHIDVEKLTSSHDLNLFIAMAQGVIAEDIQDPVNGANHYYADYMKPPPNWAAEYEFVRQIGKHRFYICR
jgi:spore germination cell wall hydrolase CwlJ-like protein